MGREGGKEGGNPLFLLSLVSCPTVHSLLILSLGPTLLPSSHSFSFSNLLLLPTSYSPTTSPPPYFLLLIHPILLLLFLFLSPPPPPPSAPPPSAHTRPARDMLSGQSQSLNAPLLHTKLGWYSFALEKVTLSLTLHLPRVSQNRCKCPFGLNAHYKVFSRRNKIFIHLRCILSAEGYARR